MKDLPLDRIAALVPECEVKDLPLGRTLMMMYIYIYIYIGPLNHPLRLLKG